MNNKAVFVIFVLIAAAFLVKLGALDLWDPDEPRYAEAAREMTQSGDYLTPYFNYQVRFDKPPLFYWLIAASYKIFGVSETSARLFSCIFAILGAILVFILGKTFGSEKTGLLSSLVLASSFLYFVLAHACNTDMTFCFFILAALFCFIMGYSKEKNVYYLGAYISAALAVLAKGPAGLVLIALITGLFILVRTDFKAILKARIFTGIALFFIIAAPWYMLMVKKHGQQYIDAFFIKHHAQRYFSDIFHHQQPVYYYLFVLLIGLLPWTIFLGQSISQLLRNKAASFKEDKGFWLFVFLWALVPIIFFSLSKAKLPTYILPAFPAFSLIIGRYLSQKIKRVVSFIAAAVIIMLAVKIVAFETVLKKVQDKRSMKEISQKAVSLAQPDDVLMTAWFFEPSIVFYANKKIERISEEYELQDYIASGKRLFIFMKPQDYQRLKSMFGLHLLHEGKRYLLVSNRALP